MTRLAAVAALCLGVLASPAQAEAAAPWGPFSSPGGTASAKGKAEAQDEDNSFQASLKRTTTKKGACAWLVVDVREDLADWHTLRFSHCGSGAREITHLFYEANWIKVRVCDGTAAKPVTCTRARSINLA